MKAYVVEGIVWIGMAMSESVVAESPEAARDQVKLAASRMNLDPDKVDLVKTEITSVKRRVDAA